MAQAHHGEGHQSAMDVALDIMKSLAEHGKIHDFTTIGGDMQNVASTFEGIARTNPNQTKPIVDVIRMMVNSGGINDLASVASTMKMLAASFSAPQGQGYQQAPPAPQAYQPPPQPPQAPQSYQPQAPQSYQPQGYPQGPQGYQPQPPQGYQPQGPQGYQPPPQGYPPQAPQGYQPQPQGYQPQAPQGYQPQGPQGYQPPPQGYQPPHGGPGRDSGPRGGQPPGSRPGGQPDDTGEGTRKRKTSQLHDASTNIHMRSPHETGQRPAVAIRESVTPDYIICLEDGKKMKMLKRHLRTSFGMTPEDYRSKWGLPGDYPMTAPNYALQKADHARNIGLGTSRKRSRESASSRAQQAVSQNVGSFSEHA